MQEITIVSGLNPTKTDIKRYADSLIENVESGNQGALSLALSIKVVEELMKELKDRLLEYSLTEIDLHPSGKAEIDGAKIERVEAGVKYDYSNDDVWVKMNEELNSIKDKMKSRESILKSIPEGITMFDEDGTGISCPTKTSTTTIKITLAK